MLPKISTVWGKARQGIENRLPQRQESPLWKLRADSGDAFSALPGGHAGKPFPPKRLTARYILPVLGGFMLLAWLGQAAHNRLAPYDACRVEQNGDLGEIRQADGNLPDADLWPMDDFLRHLQSYRPMHAVNTVERMALYQASPEFNAIDLDARFDVRRGQWVVSHDSPTLNAPLLSDWLDLVLALPPETTGVVKIDVKHPAGLEGLIRLLQAKGPDAWKGRVLILNADIAMGSSHRGAGMTLAHMRTLRAAFPEAVISLGIQQGVPLNGLLTVEMRQALRALDGVKSIAIPAGTPLNVSVLQLLKEENAFATIWGKVPRQACIERYQAGIPREYQPYIWVEAHKPVGI